MNKSPEEEFEVLPPEIPSKDGGDSLSKIPESTDRRKFRLHPVSGLLVILIDTLFFGGTVISGGWALPLVCALAFGVTSIGVFLSQKILSKDRFSSSFAKAILSGILAGVPTPISGTIFGTFVLISAGLKSRGKQKTTS